MQKFYTRGRDIMSLILVLLLTLLVSSGSNLVTDCPSNCKCSSTPLEQTFICTASSSSQVSIISHQNLYSILKIKCYKDRDAAWTSITDLSQLLKNSISEFSIENCLFPYDNSSFVELIKKIPFHPKNTKLKIQGSTGFYMYDENRFSQISIGLNHFDNYIFVHVPLLEYLDIEKNLNISNKLLENQFFYLTALKYLDLRQNELLTLPAKIFSHLTKLISLDLRDNSISHLDAEIFASLSELQTLCLKNNVISQLPEIIFENLIHLQSLDLENNNLTLENTPNIFSNLINLKTLDLKNNPLRKLPEGLFKKLKNLESLDLQNCELIFVDGNTFSKLLKLSYIFLDGNPDLFFTSPVIKPQHDFQLNFPIGSIFSKLANLTKLSLEKNKLITLHPETFNHQINLKTLELKYNNLKNLPEEIFQNITSLKCLYLNENQLESLPGKIFSMLPILNYLYLNSNNLSTLPEELFAHLHQLKELHLDENKLTSIFPATFRSLHNLISLYLHSNKLQTLHPLTFFGLQSLKMLKISNNELVHVDPVWWQHLSCIENVDLMSNFITSFKVNDFEKLKSNHAITINLRFNRIKVVDMTSPPQRDLKNVTLQLLGNILDCQDCDNLPFLLQLENRSMTSIRMAGLGLCKIGNVRRLKVNCQPRVSTTKLPVILSTSTTTSEIVTSTVDSEMEIVVVSTVNSEMVADVFMENEGEEFLRMDATSPMNAFIAAACVASFLVTSIVVAILVIYERLFAKRAVYRVREEVTLYQL